MEISHTPSVIQKDRKSATPLSSRRPGSTLPVKDESNRDDDNDEFVELLSNSPLSARHRMQDVSSPCSQDVEIYPASPGYPGITLTNQRPPTSSLALAILPQSPEQNSERQDNECDDNEDQTEEYLRIISTLKSYTQHLQDLLTQNNIAFSNMPDDLGDVFVMPSARQMEKKGYFDKFRLIQQLVGEIRQPVEIRFNGLNYKKARVKGFAPLIRSFFGVSEHVEQKPVLKNLSGVIRPGTLTLVLGPPGSGKHAFLQTLAGLLKSTNATLEGEVLYNGHNLWSDGFVRAKASAYISREDVHLSNLTVYETLDFAGDCTGGATDDSITDIFVDMLNIDKSNLKVDALLELLGMDGKVAHTKIGDPSRRGVSGGQRRRVTTGEMLTGLQSVYFGDSISTGLDSSTTLEMVKAMRVISDKFGCSFVLSLLQCPQEVFEVFDDVVMLSRGEIIYHGPIEQVIPHFASVETYKPIHNDLKQGKMDMARFLQIVMHADTGNISTEALVNIFKESNVGKAMEEKINEKVERIEWPSHYTFKYQRSKLYTLGRLATRHFMVLRRDRSTFSRLAQCIIMSLLLGSLFFDLDLDDFVSRFGLFFFVVVFLGLGGKAQIPLLLHSRQVFFKQHKMGFYPTFVYVIAQSLATVPISILETMFLSPTIYFLAGLSPGSSRFFTFCFVLFLISSSCNQLMRLIAHLAPNMRSATPLSGLCLVLCVLFSGYMIAHDDIPIGWLWLFSINPFAFGLRALANNEFSSAEFNQLVYCPAAVASQQQRGDGGDVGFVGCPTMGEVSLAAYGVREVGVWQDCGSLAVVYFACLAVNCVVLHFARQVFLIVEDEARDHSASQTLKSPGIARTPRHKSLEVTPVTLAFDDVRFVVTSNRDGHEEEYPILGNAEGFIRPGTMTALLGPSGCGKTTLLDLLAGRKTTGRFEGKITFNNRPMKVVNGLPRDRKFSRLAAYVEQNDIHNPLSTVHEALVFSATLRAGYGLTKTELDELVSEIEDRLGLSHCKSQLIGSRARGLTSEDRKKLTIAVELVSNPSVLFLDEPTSGLNALSAQRVMELVRALAASSRSVICTIHQPSASIFELFDQVLVLGKGGYVLYFGPMNLAAPHFSRIQGVNRIPQGFNPSSYILDIISADNDVNRKGLVNFQATYQTSLLGMNNNRTIKRLLKHADDDDTDSEDEALEKEKVPTIVEYKMCLWRAWLNYWRAPNYNVVRLVVYVFIAVLFGTVYAGKGLTTQTDIISRIASMYIPCLFLGTLNTLTAITVFSEERSVFARERASSMYGVKPYVVSYTIAEIPYIALSSLFFVILFYFAAGMRNAPEPFIWFYLFFTLFTMLCTYAGQFFSAFLPTQQLAMVLASLTISISALTSGFLIAPQHVPEYWMWLMNVNPLMFALEGLSQTQFHDNHDLVMLVDGRNRTVEQYGRDHFGGEFQYEDRFYNVLALVAFVFATRIGTVLALKYRTLVRR